MIDVTSRVQCRTRMADGTFQLVDVLATHTVAGYTFLIHARDGGYAATYAPVGLTASGSHDTSDQVIIMLESRAHDMSRVINGTLERMARDHMPLFSGEQGIVTDLTWQWRESQRFTRGEYLPVPTLDGREYPESHYLHLSVTKTETDFVAYTPSDAYGIADRQVRLKFGKYLKKTFADMSDSAIQSAVVALRAHLALADSPASLHFATDRETLNTIFETAMYACDSSYTSCMHGKFNGDDVRPYHVYADSPDVAVAYVLERGAIVARSVVSTKRKNWIRCYSVDENSSTKCHVLTDLLKAQGFTRGDLTGNKLTRLHPHDVMLPYIDNGGMDVVDDGAGFWRVVENGDGEYTADQTDGSASENDRDRCEGCQCHRDDCECCSTCNRHRDDCQCSYCECCEETFRHGCNTCQMCDQCDACITHGACDCDRCEHCHEIISPRSRHTTSCDCDRCDACGELTRDCECEPETDDSDIAIETTL